MFKGLRSFLKQGWKCGAKQADKPPIGALSRG